VVEEEIRGNFKYLRNHFQINIDQDLKVLKVETSRVCCLIEIERIDHWFVSPDFERVVSAMQDRYSLECRLQVVVEDLPFVF
jgi:hypothetical protein